MGAAGTALNDLHAAMYSRRPYLAARRLAWYEQNLAAAIADGDDERAEALAAAADQFRRLLRGLERCRRCGRPLKKLSSVKAGIGPECAGKAK